MSSASDRRARLQSSAPPDQHVVPADGRQARIRRRRNRKAAESSPPVEASASPLPPRTPPDSGEKSLRERRAERRRRRLRRQGIDPDRPDTRVRPMGVVWVSWRWLSGGLTIILLVVLYVLLFSELFYIDSMAVGGEHYLTREQIFQLSGLANKHLFWVDPDKVEEELKAHPSISDARVFIGWPPNMVSIFVTEREPAIIWEVRGGERSELGLAPFRVWVDVNGTVIMNVREDRGDLVRVVDYTSDEPLGIGSQVDRSVIAGALQLKNMFPNIETLQYDPVKGLGYTDGRGWTAWFGTGTDMEMKTKVYDKIVRQNYPEIQFLEVNVSNPDHPYFVNRFPTE